MTYITKQGLIDRFGQLELLQLTDRTNRPATTIDDVVVNRAIGDAAAEIDSYLAKAYALPITTVPAVLERKAADIARFFLHGKSADKDGPVAIAYRDAIAWLRDVARGLVEIDTGGDKPAQAGGGSVKASAPNRAFTRDSMRGM